MKTLRKFSLAILLCLFGLTALAACGSQEADAVLSKILLIQEGEDVDADFTVPKTVKYNSETYDISWSSSDEKLLSFVENEDTTLLTADVHQPFDENKDVTLTASRDVNGKKTSVSFKTTVVKIEKETAMNKAIENAGVAASYLEATTVELPAKTNEYAEEITFTYVLDGTYTSTTLTGNTLAMDPTLASENVSLKVTATCGETVVTKTLTIAVTGALFAEGMPYVLRLYQGNLEKNLYLTSQMSNYYAKTTDNPAAAEAVYLEATTGGYYMYFLIEGVKTYINVVPSGTYRNIKFETTASSVWSLNGTYNTLTTLVEGEEYYLGAYNSYETVGPSAISYAETSFPFHLEISTGLAYNMYSVQGNLEKTLYLTGEYAGYYAATSDNIAMAASVYFESVEGGYHMYMLSGDVKTYINVVPSGTYRNIKFETTASSVWNVNAKYSTFSTFVEGEEYYLGTYNTYETVGPSAISYAETSFPCHFGIGSGSTVVIDTIPDTAVNLTVSNEGKVWVNVGDSTNVTEYMTSETYVTITAYKNSWAANPEYDAATQGYFYLSATTARLYAASEGTNGSSLEIKVANGYQIDNLYLFLESGELVVLVGGTATGIAEGTTNTYTVNADTVVIQNQGTKVAKIEAIAFTVSNAHVHEYATEWSSDATNHWHACSCGDKNDLAAHTFGAWTTVTPAGNGVCGTDERVCACGYKETRTTHSVATEWSSDATNHWHASTCACTDKHETATHTFGAWVEVTAATETVDGVKERYCSVCNYKETGVIPSLGHTHNYDVTTFKYDETGHWNECACGDKANEATHTFGEWTVTTPATDETAGEKRRDCTECDYYETDTIPTYTLQSGELAATSLGSEQVATSAVPTYDLVQQVNNLTPLMVSAVANRNTSTNNYGVYYSSANVRLYKASEYTDGDLTTIGASIVFTALPGLTVKNITVTLDSSYAEGMLVIVNGQIVTGTNNVYAINANEFTIAASTANIRITKIEISYYGDADLTDATDYQIYYFSANGTALEGISGSVSSVGEDYATVKATDGFTYYVKASTTLADWETKFAAGNIVTIPAGVKGVADEKPAYLLSDLTNVTSEEVYVTWAEYAAAEANTALGKMKGVVTASNGKGSAMLAVYENGSYVGAVYVYGATTFSDWNTVFVVGKEVTLIQGTKAIYNTLNEYKLAALTDAVLGGDGTIPPYQDVTSIVAEAADLAAMKAALVPYQGALIQITGVYASGLLTSNTDTTVGLKYYYGSSYLATAPSVTMVEGSTYTVTGFLDVYNGTYEITPLSTDAITAVN